MPFDVMTKALEHFSVGLPLTRARWMQGPSPRPDPAARAPRAAFRQTYPAARPSGEFDATPGKPLKIALGFIWLFTSLLSIAVNAADSTEIVGNAQAGASKVAMCIGCHAIEGYRTAFPEVYRVPILGGQNAKYIEIALHDYKKRTRKYATMRAIAASLSNQDIADIAAYYAAQTPFSRDNPDRY